MYAAYLPSPVGPLHVTVQQGRLVSLYTAEHHRFRPGEDTPRDELIGTVREQLDAYFAGTRRTFDLPLDGIGTPFERRVWDVLQTIPFGTTTSYGAIARELGTSARAVGRANGRNPISIIVPCHRVVGTNGSLTGYAGGLETKRALLSHEEVCAGRSSGPPGVAF
jgi:methylated-DNA-[protein]-cysteine S-methyltransferase